MAVAKVRTSDYSGKQFDAKTGARIRVMWNDKRKVDLRADLTDAEVKQLLSFCVPVEQRPDRWADPARVATSE